jgi:hypothetical protein
MMELMMSWSGMESKIPRSHSAESEYTETRLTTMVDGSGKHHALEWGAAL